jgi:hypothetical protein
LKQAVIITSVVLALSAAAFPAAGHEATGAESPASVTGLDGQTKQTAPSPWDGTTLLFDQSVTTQTFHLGGDYQSYDPTYEWWLAFKPRYTVYDHKNDAVSVYLWMNLYLELTNSDTTTTYREPLLGPTWLWATYAHTFREVRDYKTTLSAGPRLTLPTDKGAYDIGQFVGLGAVASVAQTFPLLGKGARALNGARLGLGVIYNHPFDRSTGPVNGDIHQLRDDIGGRPIVSDQLSGQMNQQHSLNLSFFGDLKIARRLELSLSYILLNAWDYAPRATEVCITSGCVTPTSIANPTTYRVNTWLVAALEYGVIEELSVSLGYYNLANQLAPDGTRRDPLWSPTARIFLTLTSNLDAVYRRVTKKPVSRPIAAGPQTAQATPIAQTAQ